MSKHGHLYNEQYSNFNDEIYYEQHPESTLVQMLWITPAVLFLGYVVYKVLTA